MAELIVHYEKPKQGIAKFTWNVREWRPYSTEDDLRYDEDQEGGSYFEHFLESLDGATVGLYPYVYGGGVTYALTKDGDYLCAECAFKEVQESLAFLQNVEDVDGEVELTTIIDVPQMTYDEGEDGLEHDVTCVNCNETIVEQLCMECYAELAVAQDIIDENLRFFGDQYGALHAHCVAQLAAKHEATKTGLLSYRAKGQTFSALRG